MLLKLDRFGLSLLVLVVVLLSRFIRCIVARLQWGILKDFDVPVTVYLPAEHVINPETMKPEFLLG